MDLTSPNTKSPPQPQPEAAESTEAAAAPPSRIQTTKHLSFTNGVLKRHHHHNHHQHHHPIVITYKECLKNHAASLGGHALDGCGEFMPSPTATATDPTSLKCAACGCHRNFHRRDPDDINSSTAHNTTNVVAANNNHNHHTATIEYQPHHRHHPPPPPSQPIPNPPASNRSPNSSSPPPISSSYYPSAPHMLLALSGSLQQAEPGFGSGSGFGSSRKRFRTKFSQSQKEKMYEFAEKVGWKMQKRDEDIVNEFCNEVGVDRTVLKVWMHNNKNTFGRQLQTQQQPTNGSIIRAINLENSEDKKKDGEDDEADNNNSNGGGLNRHFDTVPALNGGSSSSS